MSMTSTCRNLPTCVTLFVLALSLILSLPFNAETTFEERVDGDRSFNIGMGRQQQRGDKISTDGFETRAPPK